MNNSVACLSPGNLGSEYPSTQVVGSVSGRTSKDPGIVDWIKRRTTAMLLIMSTLSFLYTTLQFIYSTFIHIYFSQWFYLFVLITHLLFKSWQESAAQLLLRLLLPAPGEADNLSTTRILMTITVWYPTITMIVRMTIQNLMTNFFGNHPGKKYASGLQKIHSRQHWQN